MTDLERTQEYLDRLYHEWQARQKKLESLSADANLSYRNIVSWPDNFCMLTRRYVSWS